MSHIPEMMAKNLRHYVQYFSRYGRALMLLMLLPGVMNLAWMLGLAALMAVEKNLSWGREVVKPIGIALIAAGLMIALKHLPLTGQG
jgi:predicted metal-binding membrane protein